MRLCMLSHKETWPDANSPSGYTTVGGFPFQMSAIARLFDSTHLLTCERPEPPPGGLIPLDAPNLTVQVLPEPLGSDLRRKVALLGWLPRHLPTIWHAVAAADVVHTPVPGDVGLIGLLAALLQRKPLFVRHCGTWGEPVTIADRFLLWLLERIAGGRNVVLATGGAESPPSIKNQNIQWIFSTSLTQHELEQISSAPVWDGHSPLRLVTVGRLTVEKNMAAIIEALPGIRDVISGTTLDILGEGEARSALEARATELDLRSAVTFHGNVSHEKVLEILSRSHLFVFPTRTKEGFPKAVLEALACGLPVIATRVSVIPHLLQNGAGLLLEDTTASAVTTAVLQLAANPHRLTQMGQVAQATARGYTLEAWGQDIKGHLQAAWGPLKKEEE